jgi:predicted nuclease of predicted toxin-antitoxin system
MRFKLDENIPARAALFLRSLGHDVETVLEEGLGGKCDVTIWAAAQSEGRFLITQDLDFSDMRRFAPGTHHGILLVRLEDRDQPRIAEFLETWLNLEPDGGWGGAFIVASSRKIRVMRS